MKYRRSYQFLTASTGSNLSINKTLIFLCLIKKHAKTYIMEIFYSKSLFSKLMKIVIWCWSNAMNLNWENIDFLAIIEMCFHHIMYQTFNSIVVTIFCNFAKLLFTEYYYATNISIFWVSLQDSRYTSDFSLLNFKKNSICILIRLHGKSYPIM